MDGRGGEVDHEFPGFVRCRPAGASSMPAVAAEWGGYDGYLWKVATNA